MASAGITIQVSGLDKAQVATLHKQAKTLGLSAERYAKQLIEDGMTLEQRARTESFDQITEPLRREFQRSGTSPEELDSLIDAARARHHQRSGRKRR
ncbi:MAG TPA: hypothetical protein VH475_23670 [Tepidisphaeraceae bacterium]|jgi:TRAP-type C4-dicarboxylate transport system substrate-binding protein